MEGVGAERQTVVSAQLLVECEEFFQLCSPPEDFLATIHHAREFISHYSSQRPIALVTVRFKRLWTRASCPPLFHVAMLVHIHGILLIDPLFDSVLYAGSTLPYVTPSIVSDS